MYVFQGNNIAIGNSKPATMSGTTKSLEIVNMSHLQCQVVGDTNGVIATLPPFASTIKLVNPGQEVTFNLQTPVITALTQTGEYIEINESPFAQVTGITPIALIPVYTAQVQLSGTNTVQLPSNQTVQANITNASLPISGSVNATIQNAQINSQIVNTTSSPVYNVAVHCNSILSGLEAYLLTGTTIVGTSNIILTRLKFFPYNGGGTTTTSTATISFNINGGALVYPMPNVVSTAYGNPIEIEFGDGIQVDANGIKVGTNIPSLEAYSFILTR